ncbi:hypothetical protein [Methylocystis sp.]|uniref:hypothetical protein n=1 Tax=Methylocystis sp. TaxID=1911079 RepID=UPI003DA5CB19
MMTHLGEWWIAERLVSNLGKSRQHGEPCLGAYHAALQPAAQRMSLDEVERVVI